MVAAKPGEPGWYTQMLEGTELFRDNFPAYMQQLDERLRAWVIGGTGLVWLKHPLMYSFTPESPAAINERFEWKVQRVREDLAKGDLTCISVLFEKPYRIQALTNVVQHWEPEATGTVPAWVMGVGSCELGPFTHEHFCSTLASVWMMTELPSEYPKQQLRDLFARAGFITDVEDLDGAPAPRPDMTLTLYRGMRRKADRLGLAWTTDPNKAEWFARRFAKRTSWVAEVECPPERLYARFVGRNESEYVIDPRRLPYTLHEVSL
jgi:hypothetical protein